jgi:hypothetical protein
LSSFWALRDFKSLDFYELRDGPTLTKFLKILKWQNLGYEVTKKILDFEIYMLKITNRFVELILYQPEKGNSEIKIILKSRTKFSIKSIKSKEK